MQRISNALSANILQTFLLKVKIAVTYVDNNNCKYPANKQQSMSQSWFFLQKSKLVKLK